MNTSEMFERAEIGSQDVAAALELGDEERRIRQAMRLNPKLWSKKTRGALAASMVGGAALIAGGFCLGWKAFRFWHG